MSWLDRSRQLDAEADTIRASAVGANVSYDARTGQTTVHVDAGAVRKKARKRLKRARNAFVEQARERMARGDRHGAVRLLDDAERVEQAIKAGRS